MKVLAAGTAPWLALPHRMEVLLCDAVPDGFAVCTAFALVVDAGNRTLLTRVRVPGRGWEVPGGHCEPGESPAETAARELAEETGLTLPAAELRLFGGQTLALSAPPPPGHRYPARDFMAFHAFRLDTLGPATSPPPGTEALEAAWVPHEQVAAYCPGAVWLPLHTALTAALPD
jgi:8-oxo-dGTP pyrophosphatase MutT (NUDIX family)